MVLQAAATIGWPAPARLVISDSNKKIVNANNALRDFMAQKDASLSKGTPVPTANEINADIQPDSPSSGFSLPARKSSSLTRTTQSSIQSPTSKPKSSFSSTSGAPNSIRVHTKGATLSSGFPYHPALFDVKVHPTKWEEFSNQIVDFAKLSKKERIKAWALGAGAAVATTSPDSYHIARNKSLRYQESKIKAGLSSESDSDLGELLREWNEGYFAERGLLARLELSEAALRSPSQQSKIFQREAHWHAKKEDRERIREERKFVLVLTQLYELDELPNVIHEMDALDSPQEVADTDEGKLRISEAPGDDKPLPELPAGAELEKDIAALPDKKVHSLAELPSASQYAELEGHNQPVLDQASGLVSADTHEKIQRNIRHVR